MTMIRPTNDPASDLIRKIQAGERIIHSVASDLPDYFKRKISDLATDNRDLDTEFLKSEVEMFRAAHVIVKHNDTLKKVLQFGRKTPQDQLSMIPELQLANTGGFNQHALLHAISYICYVTLQKDNVPIPSPLLLAAEEIKLPSFFRVKLEKADDKIKALKKFQDSTWIAEKCHFSLIKVIEFSTHSLEAQQKQIPELSETMFPKDLESEVMGLAIEYACYVSDSPATRTHRYFTKGSRLEP